jgi:hypothetical protein
MSLICTVSIQNHNPAKYKEEFNATMAKQKVLFPRMIPIFPFSQYGVTMVEHHHEGCEPTAGLESIKRL